MTDSSIWVGVGITLFAGLIGFIIWDSMKTFVGTFVQREQYELERNLREDYSNGLERLERHLNRLSEDTTRALRETEREFYEAIRDCSEE